MPINYHSYYSDQVKYPTAPEQVVTWAYEQLALTERSIAHGGHSEAMAAYYEGKRDGLRLVLGLVNVDELAERSAHV
jgi:hypothetical protein